MLLTDEALADFNEAFRLEAAPRPRDGIVSELKELGEVEIQTDGAASFVGAVSAFVGQLLSLLSIRCQSGTSYRPSLDDPLDLNDLARFWDR